MVDKEKTQFEAEVDLESENMEVAVTGMDEKRENREMKVSRNPEVIRGGSREIHEMEEMNSFSSSLSASRKEEEVDNDDDQVNSMGSRMVEEEGQEQDGLALMDVSSSIEANISEGGGGATKSLKDPQEIYYEIYKIAKQKAREHKVKSITHYLEAKNIKNQYLLDDLEESDPEDDINDYYYDSDVTSQSTEYTEK